MSLREWHSQQQDVECCRSQGAAFLSWGVCLEKGKNTLFFCCSVMRSCRQEVSVWFPDRAIFFTSNLVYLWNFEPQNTLSVPSPFPPKRIDCETDTSQGHQEGTAALSLPPPAPSSLVYIKLNIQIPPFFNMNRSL